MNLNAGKAWFTALKELMITQEFYSRFKLYDVVLKDKSKQQDLKVLQNLIAHKEYYLEMIEPYIQKRENKRAQGEKDINLTKLAWASCQTASAPVIAWGSNRLDDLYHEKINEYCHRIQLPYELLKLPFTMMISAIPLYYGLKNFYKGTHDGQRIEDKLTRDNAIRRYLRQLSDEEGNS